MLLLLQALTKFINLLFKLSYSGIALFLSFPAGCGDDAISSSFGASSTWLSRVILVLDGWVRWASGMVGATLLHDRI